MMLLPKTGLEISGQTGLTGPMESSAVEIIYHGSKYYSYTTGLGGLKYKYNIVPGLSAMLTLSQFITKENEDGNINSEIFMYLNASDLTSDKDSIKTRIERNHNKIDLNSRQIKLSADWIKDNNTVEFGGEAKFVKLSTNTNEYYMEDGRLALLSVPSIKLSSKDLNLNYTVFFLNDIIKFDPYFMVELGGRYLITSTRTKNFSAREGECIITRTRTIQSALIAVFIISPRFSTNLTVLILTFQRSNHRNRRIMYWAGSGSGKRISLFRRRCTIKI